MSRCCKYDCDGRLRLIKPLPHKFITRCNLEKFYVLAMFFTGGAVEGLGQTGGPCILNFVPPLLGIMHINTTTEDFSNMFAKNLTKKIQLVF
jgi:hypothetical protein